MECNVTNAAFEALASSTTSFHASGLSSDQRTEGNSSSTKAPNRRRPWPSIKATMSSCMLCRSSVIGVLHHTPSDAQQRFCDSSAKVVHGGQSTNGVILNEGRPHSFLPEWGKPE